MLRTWARRAIIGAALGGGFAPIDGAMAQQPRASITTGSLPTATVPEPVKIACRTDYDRFCPGYALGTPSLRQCMESNARQLAQACVRALLDAGLVDRSRIPRS